MASTDSRPVPRKNVAYRVTFPILDADGDLVTGATGLDSEISKDGGTFADCTNEATEIATSSGIYYLDITSTEMNADTVAIIVKTTTSGAKTTTIVMYPDEVGDYRIDPAVISAAVVAVAGADPSAVPAVNATWLAKIDWLCAFFRNKQTLNRSTGVFNIRNDADNATIGTLTATDDGTTYTRPKAT